MRILIFDDEVLIVQAVEKLVRRCMGDEAEIVGTSNGTELDSILHEKKFDICFFDICFRTDEDYGIKAAKKARIHNPAAHIIFITGFDDRMTDVLAPGIRPSGYIRKDEMATQVPKILEQAIAQKNNGNGYLCIVQDKKKQYVNLDDVLYIYYNSDWKRTEIHLKNEVQYVAKSLRTIIENQSENFIMINRNIAVCKRNIKRANVNYLKKSVIFEDGGNFKPSRNGIQNLKEFFDS